MSISEGSPSTTVTYLTDSVEHSQSSLYPTSLNSSIFFSHPAGPAPIYRQFSDISEVLVHGTSDAATCGTAHSSPPAPTADHVVAATPPPSPHLVTASQLYPPPTDAAAQAQAILSSQRADRERIRQEKADAEKKFKDSVHLVHHFRLDFERVERQLKEAERRVGETRARMRANGLLPHTGIDHPCM